MLRLGSKGPEVQRLAGELREVGFPVPDTEDYAVIRDSVRAFQEDQLLWVDGIAGRQTFRELKRLKTLAVSNVERPPLPFRKSRTPVEMRMNAALELAKFADGQGLRYGGVEIEPWIEMEAGLREEFVFPPVGRIIPDVAAGLLAEPHGATCGHFAWLVLSWWFNQMHSDIRPTWRTGRRGKWIWSLPVDGKRISGRLHRGLAEYLARVHGWRYQRMGREYLNYDALGQVNLIEWGSHVGLLLKVDDSFQLTDPRTLRPARYGLYRLSADGWYPKFNGKRHYSGGAVTFRRLSAKEPRRQYRLFAGTDLNTFGTADSGPLAGFAPRQLTVS
jgi:hypothetical protein